MAYTLDVFRQPLAADLHLDGAEAFGEVIVGLPQQLVEVRSRSMPPA